MPRYYFNSIIVDVLNRHFHSKMYFLFVHMLHTRFLHNKFLLYTFLLYAITCYFGVIHFFQASSIKPDQSWVQSVTNNIGLIISFTCHCYFSHTSWVCYIKDRLTTNKHTFIAQPQASYLKDQNSNICDHSRTFLTTFPAWLSAPQYLCDKPVVWEHPIWGYHTHFSLLKALRLTRNECVGSYYWSYPSLTLVNMYNVINAL